MMPPTTEAPPSFDEKVVSERGERILTMLLESNIPRDINTFTAMMISASAMASAHGVPKVMLAQTVLTALGFTPVMMRAGKDADANTDPVTGEDEKTDSDAAVTMLRHQMMNGPKHQH